MSVFSIFIPLALGFLCTVSVSSTIPKDPFLGIAPEDEKYYQSDTIACRDGSNKFTRAQLNDDFCDCPDATDEPGTSACPGGYFYCQNLGHVPLKLFSSRVNDGLCDCCDGSDEYDGTVECQNTCWEAGKAARDKLTEKIAIYQEGVTIRKRGIEQAKLDMVKDEAELSKLKSEEKILKGLVQQLKEHKEQIEKAEEKEEKERLEKEKEDKEKKEAEENANKEAEEGKTEAVEKADIKDKPLESTFDDKIENVQDSHSEQVNQRKEQIEKAEEKERLEKENEEKEKKEAKENANKEEAEEGKSEEVEKADIKNKPLESTFDDKNGNVQDSPSEQHKDGGMEKTVLPEESKEGAAFESESDIEAIIKGKESPDAVQKLETDASENTKALSSEELGRLVASRWTGENTGKQSEEGDVSKDNNHNEDDGEMPEDAHDDEYDNYASDTDDDSSRYGSDDDDDDVEDDIDDAFSRTHDSSSSYEADSDNESDFSETASTPTWLEKIQQTVQNLLQAVNPFQTPVDKSEAELVRKEYEESNAQLSKIESRISKLTKKLDLDFGPEKEFYSFYGRCFEGKQNKYVYKVCPYKQASQIETHSTTGLGYWDKFEDLNKAMVFSNGYKCWNGPDRSLKVKLRCGLKNEITDVDEPSRCEYVALLSTPAVCSEEKLKELQEKLEWMNKEQPHPHGHDEL